MAGALRRCHEHVHIRRRDDLLVADVEAVRKGDGLAGAQVGRDLGLVHVGLRFVVDEDHDDVGGLRGFRNGHHLEPVLLGDRPGFAALPEADDHVAAGIPEIERVSMALGAVADDCDLFAVKLAEVTVFFIVHFCHN